jgi:hypothetical protein
MADERTVFTKDNELTRLMAAVDQHNRTRGAAISRGQRPMELVAPRVTTGAMLRAPEGIVPPIIEPNQGTTVPTMGISRDQLPVHEGGLPLGLTRSTLPDFTKVESILIKEGVLVVDGMSFPIPSDHLREIKMYMVQAVTDAITQQLAHAFVALHQEAETAKQEMQPMSAGETGESVSSEKRQIGRTLFTMQDMPDSVSATATGESTDSSLPSSVRPSLPTAPRIPEETPTPQSNVQPKRQRNSPRSTEQSRRRTRRVTATSRKSKQLAHAL